MPSLADLTRAWLLRQLGLSSSTLTEADLQAQLYAQDSGIANNVIHASGRYYGSSLDMSSGTIAAVIDRLWVLPFEVGRTTTYDIISAEVTTAGLTGNLGRLGIYSTTNGLPDALVVDAGTFDATTLGIKELAINNILNPGLYWLGLVSQVGVAAQYRGFGSGTSKYVGDTVNPIASSFKTYRVNGVGGALPANFGAPIADSTAPKILVRAA